MSSPTPTNSSTRVRRYTPVRKVAPPELTPEVEEEPEEEEEPVEEGGLSARTRTMTLVGAFLLLALVFGTIGWLVLSRVVGQPQEIAASTGASPQTAVKIGALAPDFQLYDVFSGQPVRLSAYRGRPVWVNFWASWCPPCKAEMPDMKTRYAKYKDKGLAILGVDDREDNTTVTQFTTQNGYNWTFAVDGDGALQNKYFVTGLPTHVFVDKSGIIRAISVGGIQASDMDKYLGEIMGQ